MFTYTYVLTILLTSLGGSFLLYSFGVINPAQEVVCQWLNDVVFLRHQEYMTETQLNFLWSIIVASNPLGGIFGAVGTKFFAERFGRRNALIYNGIVAVIGSALSIICKPANSPELLITSRILLGFAMGLASGLAPMYMMEITPSRYRGVAGTLHQVAVSFSDWFSLFMGLPEVFGDEQYWPLALAFPGLLSAVLVVLLPFCPESPKFIFVQRHKEDKALAAVTRFVGPVEADPFFKALQKEAEIAATENKGSYTDLFSRRDLRRPLIVTILGVLAQQATGCGAVFAFSTHMFMKVNIDGQMARFATVAIGIVYFLAACVSTVLIERVGRRCLLLFQLFVCGTSLAAMSGFTLLQEHGDYPFTYYGSMAVLLIYMAAYGVGSPVPWMIPNELFTTKFRSTAVTVSVVIVWTIMFIVSMTFMPMQQEVGIAYSYLPFVFATFGCAIALYFLLPETKHVNDKVADQIIDPVPSAAA